jgi:hypothetical protein
MQVRRTVRAVLAALLMACLATPAAFAQITTGTIAGTVQDSQGGVIPGATVVLISESRGTRSVPVVTSANGDYVFPNMTPDTYTVEVTMPGFRTLQRRNVAVSGGDRITVPVLTIEPGGASETIEVSAEAPLIQAQSGERSFAVTSAQVDSLPLGGGRNFAALIAVVPGVSGGPSQNGARLGGASQDNIMMDGISAMDTGNNAQMIQMNIESIAEVKVLTSGYQAEYGRSSGLQITAVTKSGTNRFSGSLYDIEDNSDWNTNSWQNKENGSAKPVAKARTWGYSLGGPLGRPGGDNKLFFFYSHEYRPSKTGGELNRFRVPTALERVGDFSQSLDNNGRPIPQLRSPITGQPYPNNVIPTEELYAPGLAILNQYTLPNMQQAPSTAYNLEIPRPETKNLLQQPAVRVDYQFSPALRITGKYSGQRERQRVVAGTMPGYNDVLVPWPYITNYGVTVNYTLNPTTFLEATYGTIKNELAGGGSGGLLVNPAANRLTNLAALPLIYPDAGRVDPSYYQYEALKRGVDAGAAVFFDGTSVNLPPSFAWGNLVGNAPPNVAYPGWLNVNKTQDVAVSLTKVAGRHTFKAGFYNNHSYKAQNIGAGGGGTFQGEIQFNNSTNNPLDTGFGFANAATGVFTQFSQASRLVEGSMIYNNTEFYVQDNWKVTNRLTLDYGMRFTRQQPQHDQFGQMSNFFPELWNPAAAPLLYVAGCNNGAPTCSGNAKNAMNPVTGEILTAPGTTNTQSAIGTIIPGSGDLTNGIRMAGDGISKYSYVWPTLVYGPRFGMAYDLTGTQSVVLRAGGGLFYDRPDGNTVFSIPGNPPIAESQTLTNSMLQNLGTGLSTRGASNLVVFQYDGNIPSSVQWNAGVQMALPWASSLDVSYVGNYGYNRLGGFQGGTQANLNQVNLGAAYLPENQDPTLVPNPNAVPGSQAYQQATLLRPYRGYGSIGQHRTEFYDKYHSIQTSFNRRLRGGFSFGANYTWSILLQGNTGLFTRLQHNPDGSVQVRDDQKAYEELNKNLARQPHVFRANFVWDMPDLVADGGFARTVGYIVNDWQLSGLVNLSSGTNYDLQFQYQANGNPINLTGSPDYANNGAGARIVFLGDPGSGCSSDQYRQFNTSMVAGPTYGSIGMESARNSMRGCMQRELDLSLSRNIRLGGGRALQLRIDTFNPFGIINYTGRNATVQFTNPVDQVVVNSQYVNGEVDQTRLRPQAAGFGAVTSAQSYGAAGVGGNNYLRVVRFTARFSF